MKGTLGLKLKRIPKERENTRMIKENLNSISQFKMTISFRVKKWQMINFTGKKDRKLNSIWCDLKLMQASKNAGLLTHSYSLAKQFFF